MKKLLIISIIQIFPILLFCQIENIDTFPSEFIFFCDGEIDSVQKPINLDWVEKDLKTLKEKINPLPENGKSIETILKIFPNFFDGKCNCSSKTQDYGFGLKLSQHGVYSGYGSFLIDLLYFDDKVLKMRITLNNNSEIIEDYLRKEIKLSFDCQDGLIIYEKSYRDNLDLYIKTKGRLFIETEKSNNLRTNAINYFLNVYNGGEFYEPYYFRFGLGHKTFDYLRYFIVNEDTLALENILFSPSPTSRLLAARTLLYMQEKYSYNPNIEVEQRIKLSIEKEQVIRSGILSCSIGRYKYDYYDIVKNFDEYLKEK